MKIYIDQIVHQFPSIGHYPIVFTSVTSNKRVQTVLSEAIEAYERRNYKLKTKDLNNWLDNFTN